MPHSLLLLAPSVAHGSEGMSDLPAEHLKDLVLRINRTGPAQGGARHIVPHTRLLPADASRRREPSIKLSPVDLVRREHPVPELYGVTAPAKSDLDAVSRSNAAFAAAKRYMY